MSVLDAGLYDLTGLFLLPVFAIIGLAVIYAFVVLGAFAAEAWQRWRGAYRSRLAVYATQPGIGSPDLELWIMQRLELLRIVTRTAPMLGLIATMIPMGPALVALSNNNTKVVGENLAFAFSAVILALVSASITFAVLTVRRRWLLQELRVIERQREAVT